MNNQMTPCYVSEGPGQKARALLIGITTEAWTHRGDLLKGDMPAGQESHPQAIVMFETGQIRCVYPSAVQVIGAKEIFRAYAFPKNDGSTSPI